ncbi:sterile alpha motif domain-containing protein 9-like [Ambystoma mexicanum]|uniref:sterile alpha motif domain-containing protein 9-like n=1 Tax=Ambystoma mexicanum TaxID=8296 RepID=UPI0037E8D99B
MEFLKMPLDKWDEGHVSAWLQSIGMKEAYIQKLHDEEVDGHVLKRIDEPFLSRIGMKKGPIKLLVEERNKLLENLHSNVQSPVRTQPPDVSQEKDSVGLKKNEEMKDSLLASMNAANDIGKTQNNFQPGENKSVEKGSNHLVAQGTEIQNQKHAKAPHVGALKNASSGEKMKSPTEPLTFAKFRPFANNDDTFKYVKNTVLILPETGIIDLIIPCHEYKSFSNAVQFDIRTRKSKFANEVFRFGSACMNIRTNGTIHFGVVDSKEHDEYQHGQIIGVPVKDRSDYVDALDLIENCFVAESEAVRHCIHPPKFIEVIEKDTDEQTFVIEVDIEPSISIVKAKIFQVRPITFDHSNKLTYGKQTIYNRVGANSVPIKSDDQLALFNGMHERDSRREKAEKSKYITDNEHPEILGRKLTILLTDGKKSMSDSLWYILVTNRSSEEDLHHVNFLTRMNIFCVFDFDADSNVSGLCKKYKEYHLTNLHSLESYSIESGMSMSEFKKHMLLFDQTSWIFCNGRNDYLGGDKPCDENTWIKTKRKYLKKAVSLICGEILPKGSFVVFFLLLSPVRKPIVDTFHEFYTEMDNIICIAESRENYEVWASMAQASCPLKTLSNISIVGMKLSHVDATVESMLPSSALTKHLPILTKGLCALTTVEEEKLCSLEILCVDQCNDIKPDFWSQETIHEIESNFYHGGKVSWSNFWLADKKICGEVIEREACREVQDILNDILHGGKIKLSIARIKIFHQPGSGGSTVARQVLWKNRKDLRCAVVKTAFPPTTVSEHAVKFREYEEKDTKHCLPVLLLVEDCDEEYLDDLSHDLGDAMAYKNGYSLKPCFIIMSCKRSNVPEKLCKASPLETVAVTHKLTDDEKRLFASKLTLLEQQFKPEFILTFVLMSQEFNEQYVKDFVKHLLQGIDDSSPVTCLMRYVALLNSYVQNSCISLSHCEAFLGIGAYIPDEKDKLRSYNFKNSLSEQARLIFIELRENTTWLSSIHIIHPLVAKQILHQLSGSRHQCQIAMDLLEEKVLFQHRFGREEFIKLIKDLFLRRYRKSKGDNVDSFFSPLIEHICDTEKNLEGAIALLKAAYERLGKDPFVAQQLARLHYTNLKFEGAQYWAEVAKMHLPRDSFILDTEGQVFKKWFHTAIDEKGEGKVFNTVEVIEIIELALKAMECFRASEKAAKSEADCMNNSGYFGEVNVGCRLLELLSSVEVFNGNKERGHATKERSVANDLIKYLNEDYIPNEIQELWNKLHGRLKGLRHNIFNALEWISEDLSYFQTDKNVTEEQNNKEEDAVNNPRKWFIRKSLLCARFFSLDVLSHQRAVGSESQALLTPLVRRMNIYKCGGGDFTQILSLLSDSKDDRSAKKLEQIISLYVGDTHKESLDYADLISYILCHITLACLSPRSFKLITFPKLRELSKSFLKKKKMPLPASAHFLLTLLYWPDDEEDRDSNPEKDNILISALLTLKRLYEIKIKNVPSRKKRIYTHFFLGQGNGLDRTVHKSKIEKLLSGGLQERRLKWLNGEVWKAETVTRVLRRVVGWTEDRNVYVHGHCKSDKINILPLHFASVPHGNENVTFYLGFSFNGLVAFDIQVTK